MAYSAAAVAIFFALTTVSCAGIESSGADRLARSTTNPDYVSSKPAPMDASRKVVEQDCSKPVELYQGNLLCK
jgi:hypothetical protein